MTRILTAASEALLARAAHVCNELDFRCIEAGVVRAALPLIEAEARADLESVVGRERVWRYGAEERAKATGDLLTAALDDVARLRAALEALVAAVQFERAAVGSVPGQAQADFAVRDALGWARKALTPPHDVHRPVAHNGGQDRSDA